MEFSVGGILNGTMDEEYPIIDTSVGAGNTAHEYEIDGLDYEIDYYKDSADYMADIDDQYSHYFTKEIEEPMAHYFKYHEEEILKDIKEYVSQEHIRDITLVSLMSIVMFKRLI